MAVCLAAYWKPRSTERYRPSCIQDLYVMPEFRRKGVGERMLRCMAAAARFGRCARLHWQVLDWYVRPWVVTVEGDSWPSVPRRNRKAISVYDRIGAQVRAVRARRCSSGSSPVPFPRTEHGIVAQLPPRCRVHCRICEV